jgi:hypothetical protein
MPIGKGLGILPPPNNIELIERINKILLQIENMILTSPFIIYIFYKNGKTGYSF